MFVLDLGAIVAVFVVTDSISALAGCVGCDVQQEPHLNGSQLNGLMRCSDSTKQKTGVKRLQSE